MSKTLDDLLADFDAAVLRAQAANREEMTPWAFTRAGIIAVLTALREEMVREFERCDSCSGIEHVEPFFDEILALSEGGQAAGVPASNGGTELDRTSGPAPAAPAPVCEREKALIARLQEENERLKELYRSIYIVNEVNGKTNTDD